MTTTPQRNAVAASEWFNQALVSMAARGERTHCSDVGTAGLWLSESEGDRREAEALCIGCPVIEPCGQSAEARQERWGVWGGKDRSVLPGRPVSKP